MRLALQGAPIGLVLAALFTALALVPSAAWGAAPLLAGILPRGAQRGTEVEVLFLGARLSDAQEVFCYSKGFTVTHFQVVNDSTVKTRLKIAPDCALGEHCMRLRTVSGISELRTFYVGNLPEIAEKEPNSEFANAQPIALNVTVNGVITPEDVDYFAVKAKKGQRLTAEIEAIRLGPAGIVFDPYVAILDAKRFELAACDDCPLLGQDAVASIIVPADGTYTIQVRDSAYGGNDACAYRLHVGTFPRPLGTVPAGGKPDEELDFRFLGDVAGALHQRIRLPATVADRHGIFAKDTGGMAPSANPIRISSLPNVLEIEPNDKPEQATKATIPAALNGIIERPGDVDHFCFHADKGAVYDIQCFARRLGSPLDSVLVLSAAGGAVLAANDDAFGPDSYLRFQAPESKDYVLSIRDHLGKGGPTYFYRIEIAPVRPRLVLSIPKVTVFSQERQTLTVPRGNRSAVLIQAARADFGGDVAVRAEGLPAGVRYETETMGANAEFVPLVFEAAANAPVAGTLAHIEGKPLDANVKVEGTFNQVVELATGPPNLSVYWKTEVDRMAAAVTQEVPFQIRVIEPKVPLVHGGSLNLRVVAERKPGYKAPIYVQMLFNPPGVGSGGATIAENANEALIPMNANGAAPARPWKVAVIASAPVGNGPVWVSSQLFTLEIAPPFVQLVLERAAAEQGKNTEIYGKLQVTKPFAGSAHGRLLGLPNQVTAPDIDVSAATKEFGFKIAVGKGAPTGTHRNLFCQLVIMQNGEPILHNLGGTELRVDAPLPPPASATAKAPAAQAPAAAPKPGSPPAAAAVAAKPPAKRLSRLEQLRAEQAERERNLGK